jgi:protein-S-isoprenylcysteine O-methyltransferase Ste14
MSGGAQRILYWSDTVAVLIVWGLAARYGPRTWVWLVALAAGVVGLALWTAAKVQLGRSFSVGAQARELVTHGVYSRFRHPIYLFGGLAETAAVLAFQSWVAVVLWLLLIVPLQVTRSRREEQILEETFGQAYRDYRSRTWL